MSKKAKNFFLSYWDLSSFLFLYILTAHWKISTRTIVLTAFNGFFYTRKTFFYLLISFIFKKRRQKTGFLFPLSFFLWSQQQRIQKKIRVLRNEHKKLHSCFSLACWFYRFIFGPRRSNRESKWEKNCTLLKDQSKFSGCSLNSMKITPEKKLHAKKKKRWNGISKI